VTGDPALLIPVLRDFPGLTVVIAHGGRGWWYDAAASLALLHENAWIELSGLPAHRLPHYYARFDLRRLARKFIFGTDWPGVPASPATPVPWPPSAWARRCWPGCSPATR